MRRLFELLTLLWAAVLFTQCGGGGSDASGPSNPSPPPDAAATVASVRVNPATIALGVGQTVVLKAEALAANGSVLPGHTFVFSSSDVTVARVRPNASDTAVVEAAAVGTSMITVGAAGKSAAAGITVTTARPLDNVQVTGRVVDGETQAGIAGATVSYRSDHGQTGIVATAGDGSFSFSFANDSRSQPYVIDATANAPGYVTTRLGGAQVRPSGQQIESILVVRTRAASDGAIRGTVLDVRNGQPIAGATVRLELGQGPATQGLVASATSDARGRYSFAGLSAGTYTVLADAQGYFIGSRTAITVTSASAREQDIGLSPVGSGLEVRIVLNWGSSPADLDAHLTGPNAPGAAGRFHVSWANRLRADTAPYAGLDRDDRDGNGPETITVTRLNGGGVYRYSVRDFTNGSAAQTQELGRSGATVQVFAAGRTHTFHVPVKPGNLWTVFELAGDIANPVIAELGTMATTADADPIP
jgi:hypothetical protein